MPKQSKVGKHHVAVGSLPTAQTFVTCPSIVALVTEYNKATWLVFEGELAKVWIKILLDSGASSNFISQEFLDQHQLPMKALPRIQTIFSGDGSQKTCTTKTTSIKLQIDSFQDKIQALPLDLSQYDLILGTPWLIKHNPQIDWEGRTMTITQESDSVKLQACPPEESLEGNLLSPLQVKRAIRHGVEVYVAFIQQSSQEFDQESSQESSQESNQESSQESSQESKTPAEVQRVLDKFPDVFPALTSRLTSTKGCRPLY